MAKDDDWEDVEMAIDHREITSMQKKLATMTKEERKQFVKSLANKICDRNDEAYRRLSKN